jgi:hypothetical protein
MQSNMTKSDHEKERRAFWDACFQCILSLEEGYPVEVCGTISDKALAERDKRFPAPEESKP